MELKTPEQYFNYMNPSLYKSRFLLACIIVGAILGLMIPRNNCDDFLTHFGAQLAHDAYPAKYSGMDRNHNGIVCQNKLHIKK